MTDYKNARNCIGSNFYKSYGLINGMALIDYSQYALLNDPNVIT